MVRKNFGLDAAERADAREALRILSAGGFEMEQPLTAAARLAVGRAGESKAVRLEDAVDLFLRDCLRRNLRQRSMDFYESKLGLFMAGRESALLDSFERPALREWLEGLPVAESTRGGYLRSIKALFGWAVRQEPPLCRVDPTVGLRSDVRMVEREVEILTPDEAEAVMHGAGSFTAGAALMLFAGVRPSEISAREKPPLLWEHIDFKGRRIRIAGATAKTRVARVLEGLPDNLWKWLRAYRGEPGEPVCGPQIRFLPRWAVDKGLVVKWPQDVCRHSFATYHIALLGNVERTSLILGHEGKPRLLHQRYRGVATNAQAKKFFGIIPE